MKRAFLCLSATAMILLPVAASAQDKDAVKAEGVELAKDVQGQASAIVKDSGSPAGIVPGYAGTDLPVGDLLDDPEALVSQGSLATSTNEAYSVATTPNAAAIDPSSIDVEFATSVEVSPESFLMGTDLDGTKNGCVPVPQAGTGDVEYVASCNVGSKIVESTQTCTAPLVVSVEGGPQKYEFTCDNGFSFWAQNQPRMCNKFTPFITNGQCVIVEEPIETIATCNQADHNNKCLEPDVMIGKRLHCDSQVLLNVAFKLVGGGAVTESVDESMCASAIAGKTCTLKSETCSDPSPSTRMIDGVAVTKSCWGWERSYTCMSETPANDCSLLESDAGCTFDHEECLEDEDDLDPNGACKVKERIFNCKTPPASGGDPAMLCGGDIYCIDGECTKIEREASTEFKDAMVAVQALGDIRDQFDEDTLTLFGGAKSGCHKPVFGLVNCCAGKSSGLISMAAGGAAIAGGPLAIGALATPFLTMFMCSTEEKLLDVKDRMGLCHRVGTYCSQKALFVCTTKRTNYCCYESKLARILQEQGREQIGKGWGTAKNPQCGGFSIAEFQMLDLSVMDFTEVYSEFMDAAKVPDEIEASIQIQKKIEDYYELHAGTGS